MANSSLLYLRRFVVLFFFVATFAPAQPAGSPHPGMPRGQRHESHREIFQLEEAWRLAILKGDAAAMDSLLADDFIGISSHGTLQTKEQALARLTSGHAHHISLTISDRKVRFYGTTALVTSLAQATGTNADGEEVTGSYRYTHVYVRNPQGKWKIVSFEASKIRTPGGVR